MQKRTGSVDKQRNGRFRVRITARSKRQTVGFYDERDEAERIREASVQLVSEDYGDDAVRVGDWIDQWLTQREIGKVVSDPDSDRGRFETHIKDDSIARVSLPRLRRSHVLAWVKRVRRQVARQTTLNTLTVLRGALAAALDEERVRSNVASDIKIAREKRTLETWTVATATEIPALIDAAGDVERHIVAFAIGTGLRAGELVTLRLADVHLDHALPNVVIRYGAAPNLPTKGGKIRTVPLFGLALHAARAWLEALPAFCKRNPRGLMFPGRRGGFRCEEHVFRWDRWKQMLTTAHIERRFRWHDLRHTCASALVSGLWGRSWSLNEVQAMLGHASITTTERYAHFAGTALTRAAAETPNLSGRQAAAETTILEKKAVEPSESNDFLNRWASVQIGSGAPAKNKAISDRAQNVRGHMAANWRSVLEMASRGDSDGVTAALDLLADSIESDPLIELARMIRARHPLALTRAIQLASEFAEEEQWSAAEASEGGR